MGNPMILNSKQNTSKLTHRQQDIFQNKIENILDKKEMKLKICGIQLKNYLQENM